MSFRGAYGPCRGIPQVTVSAVCVELSDCSASCATNWRSVVAVLRNLVCEKREKVAKCIDVRLYPMFRVIPGD